MADINFTKRFRTDLATLGGAELARRIGVSAQHVSDVKQGRRQPGPMILKYYGLTKEVEVTKKVTYASAK